MNEQDARDLLLDDALETMSLAPLPDNFVENVMARVQATTPAYAPDRFRLEFVDVAVSLFAAVFLFILQHLLLHTDTAVFWQQIQSQFLHFDGLDQTWAALIILIVLAELGLGSGLFIWLFTDRSAS